MLMFSLIILITIIHRKFDFCVSLMLLLADNIVYSSCHCFIFGLSMLLFFIESVISHCVPFNYLSWRVFNKTASKKSFTLSKSVWEKSLAVGSKDAIFACLYAATRLSPTARASFKRLSNAQTYYSKKNPSAAAALLLALLLNSSS